LSSLAAAMTSGQTTLTLLAGTGSRFPSDSFPLRIWASATFANPIDDPGNEIVFCTARTGDTLTITRGQEGTAAVAHASGDAVALVITQKFRDDLALLLVASVNVVKFTASGTYTKPPNLRFARVIVQAGGGNGGAAVVTAGAESGGGGGGAGSYSESFLSASAIGATETVTVGAAGQASSFGALVTANGGSAGATGSSDGRVSGGAGGGAGTGQLTIPGGAGGDGLGITDSFGVGGHGGVSPFGGAGGQVIKRLADQAGRAAQANSGSGGSGGAGGSSTAGGAGGSGIVIVYEYLPLE
jgi:hypothetical protein